MGEDSREANKSDLIARSTLIGNGVLRSGEAIDACSITVRASPSLSLSLSLSLLLPPEGLSERKKERNVSSYTRRLIRAVARVHRYPAVILLGILKRDLFVRDPIFFRRLVLSALKYARAPRRRRISLRCISFMRNISTLYDDRQMINILYVCIKITKLEAFIFFDLLKMKRRFRGRSIPFTSTLCGIWTCKGTVF